MPETHRQDNEAAPRTDKVEDFAQRLLRWYQQHGRKSLPWQQQRSPYRVWVSEIMLQQTQVSTVIPYYERFMARFPTVAELAQAAEDEVLHLWTGLGYYARARNLHRCAQLIHSEHQDSFPDTVDALSALPGIGRSTAGAILSLGSQRPAVILDGNVKRVLTRHEALPGWPGQSAVEKQLWDIAARYTPESGEDCQAYTQAIMDLGATLCTRSRPACALCPVQDSCQAHAQGRMNDFPEKKPKKALPIRATQMLIFSDGQQRVLLQKRPPQGIWGGLWSFPETSDYRDTLSPFLDSLLASSKAQDRWQTLRHTFSHYHLDITPIVIQGQDFDRHVMENERWHWYDLRQPPRLGLAAPVSKLLALLNDMNT